MKQIIIHHEFTKIQPQTQAQAIKDVINKHRQELDIILSQPTFSWTNLANKMFEQDEELSMLLNPFNHLNSVANSQEMREPYSETMALLSEFYAEIGQNKKLFEAIESLTHSSEYSSYDEAQKKIISDYIRSFRLSGVHLPDDKKSQLIEISMKHSKLRNKFSNNVLDGKGAWHKTITNIDELKGLSDNTLNLLSQESKKLQKSNGWTLTLSSGIYALVMKELNNRPLREKLYRAYITVSSDLAESKQFDNINNILEMLTLRQKSSKLLGFNNYIEESLATKMAETPKQVIDFLEDLAVKARPSAIKELDTLKQYANDKFGVKEFQPWDYQFISEEYRKEFYNISEEEVKAYFPLDAVLQGLFGLLEKIYKVRFVKRNDVNVWDSKVVYYDVFDQQNQIISGIYIDLFARSNKRDGAWMSESVNRFKRADSLQIPIAFVVCNFPAPSENEPSLLPHGEVETLFHEFGHALQFLLTKVDYPPVAGVNGVEWDAVELPSQFNENWTWEPEVLKTFAKHYQTQETIPDSLITKLLNVRNYLSGLTLLRQIEFGLLDLRLHEKSSPVTESEYHEIINQVRKKVRVLPVVAEDKSVHSFSHIFSGGYSAGYFSYLWAEVLSADAFAKFQEEGIFNPSTAESFKKNILEVGGSKPAMEAFKAFRGREPKPEALLKSKGILV